MPTYEYECEDCKHSFDVLQSMTDKRLRKCPACGKMKLNRLIGSGAGMIFKGTGFYQTDYKNPKPAAANKNESAPASQPQAPSASPSTCCGGGCGK